MAVRLRALDEIAMDSGILATAIAGQIVVWAMMTALPAEGERWTDYLDTLLARVVPPESS